MRFLLDPGSRPPQADLAGMTNGDAGSSGRLEKVARLSENPPKAPLEKGEDNGFPMRNPF